jgi:hypothetical protein
MAAEEFRYDVIKALRELALAFPETDEGDSCVKRAFRARTKGFLYLGERETSYNMMVKLVGSLEEARSLEVSEPHHFAVGKSGWVTMNFGSREVPPPQLIERWIDESYRLQAPPALIAELDG